MTLDALRLANFKAFGSSQRVPLRRITLLYGANSAGKSSVLHALALAHHAIETGELDTRRTQIGGDSIDLGGFQQYVHRRQRERQVELGFEIDPGRLSGRLAELLQPARNIFVELAIGSGLSVQRRIASEAHQVSGETGLPQDLLTGMFSGQGFSLPGVHVERFRLEIDQRTLLSMSARRHDLLRLDQLDHGHPVFREVIRGLLTMATTTQEVDERDFTALSGVIDSLVPAIVARRRGLFPQILDDLQIYEDEDDEENVLAISRGRRQQDLARAARLFVPKLLRDLFSGLATELEGAIRKLHYLGPLRSYPPRNLAPSQYQDPNWFAGGGYAWDVVRTRADVRTRVNKWLGNPERLKTPYELVVRELVPASALPAELAPKLGTAFHDLARQLLGDVESEERSELLTSALKGVRDTIEGTPEADDTTLSAVEDLVGALVDAEAVTESWIRAVVEARGEALQDLVLIDKRSGTAVSHRDVGIGVSQVLPVLVSAYASHGRLLAIEQPEIHLHPALQAELGDVVLESALGYTGNSFLIETHSEHLLLRIMRRMRETEAGELPESMPAVRPEDVMVLFVEPDGGQSLVREMPLNERGELVKAWPGGFFEEGLREIF